MCRTKNHGQHCFIYRYETTHFTVTIVQRSWVSASWAYDCHDRWYKKGCYESKHMHGLVDSFLLDKINKYISCSDQKCLLDVERRYTYLSANRMSQHSANASPMPTVAPCNAATTFAKSIGGDGKILVDVTHEFLQHYSENGLSSSTQLVYNRRTYVLQLIAP